MPEHTTPSPHRDHGCDNGMHAAPGAQRGVNGAATGNRLLNGLGLLLTGTGVGWVLWTWFGGVEGAVMAWTFPGHGIPAAVMLLGVLAYGITGALLGLGVGLGAALATILRPSARARLGTPFLSAMLFLCWFGGVFGGGLTFRNMPRALTPASLGMAAAFVGAGIPLAIGVWYLVRALRHHLEPAQRRMGVVALAALPVVVGLIPMLHPALIERDAAGDSVNWLQENVSTTDATPDAGPRPNVLFILVDTLRSDHLGTYGYPLATSPTIDSLATTGLQCDYVIASSSWTRPAVATIFSGLYPSTHGLTNYFTGFSGEALLLPEMLQSQGYHTAIFSNNGHVSRNYGFSQGVDHMNATASSTYQFFFLGAISYRFGVRLGFSPALVPLDICQTTERLLMPGAANDGTGEDLNRYFTAWLDDRPAEPFFAYIHYFEPHAPYIPPSPWDAMYDAVENPDFAAMPPADRDMYAPYEEGTELPPEQLDYMVRRYDAEIRYQDSLLREVLAAVRERGLDRNTLVVFTSDHGEEFRDHGHWGHGKSLFHEVTDVPLIFAGADRFEPGSHYGGLIEQVDLLPTVLGLVGLPIDPLIVEGEDLAAVLTDPLATGLASVEESSDRVAMSELSQNGFDAVAVEDEHYLYIALDKRGDQRELLYDLLADPACERDLSAEAGDLVEIYRAQLEQKRGELLASRAQVGGEVMGEETLEKLKALGYVN